MRERKSIVQKGVRHGLWTALGVTKWHYKGKSRSKVSLFECDCGYQAWHSDWHVANGLSRSCKKCTPGRKGFDAIAKLTDEQRARKRYVDRLWPDRD